jgi:hypothetical protein
MDEKPMRAMRSALSPVARATARSKSTWFIMDWFSPSPSGWLWNYERIVAVRSYSADRCDQAKAEGVFSTVDQLP